MRLIGRRQRARKRWPDCARCIGIRSTPTSDLLAAADRQRGRFRAFLLTALKNFLANEHRRATAGKRGGPQPPLSLDFQDGEERYTCERLTM